MASKSSDQKSPKDESSSVQDKPVESRDATTKVEDTTKVSKSAEGIAADNQKSDAAAQAKESEANSAGSGMAADMKPPASISEEVDRRVKEDAVRAADFQGSNPLATSDVLAPVEPPHVDAPTAPEGTGDEGGVPRVFSDRAEGTKVKENEAEGASIADKQVMSAKELSRQFRDSNHAISERYQRAPDFADIPPQDRKLSPAEEAVLDVMLEAQGRAAASVEIAQATAFHTATVRMGVEAVLPATVVVPTEFADTRKELVEKLRKAQAELERYDETVPLAPDPRKADLRTLAEVGPNQTLPPPTPVGVQLPPKARDKPDKIVEKIMDRVVALMTENGHDYHTARKMLQMVGKRLGRHWAKHRERSKPVQVTVFDPNAMIRPIDGSGNKFNVYADSAGMIGDKQISSPEYMVPYQVPKPPLDQTGDKSQ